MKKAYVELEEELAAGNTIEISALDKSDGLAIVSHFNRHYRSRGDIAHTSQSLFIDVFSNQIETIRNLITRGDLDRAQDILLNCKPITASDRVELSLEQSRINLFLGKHYDVIDQTNWAIKVSAASELTRMTLHQVRGHALILQNKLEKSVEELKHALVLAEHFPLAASATSCMGLLAQAYSLLKDKNKAEYYLQLLQSQIVTFTNESLWIDRLLYLLRAKVHFSRAFEPEESTRLYLLESLAIAEWLNKVDIIKKCQHELSLLSANHIAHMQVVNKFSNWTYLQRVECILHEFPKSIIKIDKSPIANSILSKLCKSPCHIDDLFEQVWRLPFSKERHSCHIRAIISKIRKLLPNGALVVNNGLVSLK